MQYFVYYDGYGHVRQVISADDLDERFAGDPERFLASCLEPRSGAAAPGPSGHVGTLVFDTAEELQEFLERLGDEVEGFFCCRSESRPYNF